MYNNFNKHQWTLVYPTEFANSKFLKIYESTEKFLERRKTHISSVKSLKNSKIDLKSSNSIKLRISFLFLQIKFLSITFNSFIVENWVSERTSDLFFPT